MKIIFQDIDGCLNNFAVIRASERGTKSKGSDTNPITYLVSSIGPELVSRLNRLVEATQAVLVISSTWRKWYTIEQMKEAFKTQGFQGTIIGMTPDNGTHRGLEIAEWLEVNKDRYDVESFVILDDDSDMSHLKHRLVKTSMLEGLCDDHVDRAIAMLNE